MQNSSAEEKLAVAEERLRVAEENLAKAENNYLIRFENHIHPSSITEKMVTNSHGHIVPLAEGIAERYGQIMTILEIPFNDDNSDTPIRVAKALIEMTSSLNTDLGELIQKCTTFENKRKGVLVQMDDIEYSSMCSHHHLPFFGKVKIDYVPNERIIGLSKFDRIVDFFSRKPQVQEEFTHEIADFIINILDPHYLSVEVYDSTHTCMCSRGVRSKAKTTTKYVYGEMPK